MAKFKVGGITSKVLWMRKTVRLRVMTYKAPRCRVALCEFVQGNVFSSPSSTITAGTGHFLTLRLAGKLGRYVRLPPLPFLSPLCLCVFMPAASLVCCADCRGKEKKRVWQRLRITHADLHWPKTQHRGLCNTVWTSHSAYFWVTVVMLLF